MKGLIVVAVALTLTGSALSASAVEAQVSRGLDEQRSGMGNTVTGQVKAIGADGTITLDNGTTLALSDQAKANARGLREGAMVQAVYQNRGGQKVVTDIAVLGGRDR
jgi:hypothetical protein